MKKVYTQREVKEKRRTFVNVLSAGMGAALLLLLIRIFGGGEIFFTASLVVLVSLYAPLGWIMWFVLRWKFSEGRMLQIKNGAVIGYFEEPFYYNPRKLDGSVFVPFRQEDVVVEKTLYLPVSGRIFSCSLLCEGRVVNFQRYYDKFISLKKEERPDLQQAIRACMATFFQSQRERIAALGAQAVLVEEDVATATHLIQQDAEKYLRGELSSCGFAIHSVFPVCVVKPLIIA